MNRHLEHPIGHGHGQFEEKPFGKKCTYLDCLCGRAPVPHGNNGDVLFTVLMTGGMVAFMTTANGLRNTGLGFLEHSLWLYPLIFCISLLLRWFVTGRIFGKIRRKVLEPNFEGIPLVFLSTVTNTLITSPIMCTIVTLLLVGPDNLWANYFATLPITMPISVLVSYFIVGPAVKIIFNNHISPDRGMTILREIEEEGMEVARMMGLS